MWSHWADLAVHLRANFQQWRQQAKRKRAPIYWILKHYADTFPKLSTHVPPDGGKVAICDMKKGKTFKSQNEFSKHVPGTVLNKTISNTNLGVYWEDSLYLDRIVPVSTFTYLLIVRLATQQ